MKIIATSPDSSENPFIALQKAFNCAQGNKAIKDWNV